MSTLNLGLQCIGLMCPEMDPAFEAEVKKCKNLAKLRDAARRVADFKTTALDSVAHVKSLLVMLLDRLELKGKKFCMFLATSEDNLDLMWSEVQKVDSILVKDESLTKKSSLPSKPDLCFERCCVCHHYCFQIKKCGSDECTMCKPPKLPRDIFDTIHFLPDPIQGDDGHYMTFEELLGSNTDESHRPSLQKSAKSLKLFHLQQASSMLKMWI